jgi:medium-chain acyl-[acyl-carrier-protein] hydrolase
VISIINREEATLEWTEKYRINFRHLAPDGDASLVELIELTQATAWKHADSMGLSYSSLMDENLMFALAWESIDLQKRPGYGDTVKVLTRLPGTSRLYFYRDFLITDGSSNSILEARTTWTCLDTKTRRPQRLDELSDELDFPYLGEPANVEAPDFSSLEKNDHCYSTTVRPSDLDVNSHANNVQYIRWVMDTLPLDFLVSKVLDNFDIKYRAELSSGDELLVERSELGSTISHGIVRKEDGEIVALAESSWSRGDDKGNLPP